MSKKWKWQIIHTFEFSLNGREILWIQRIRGIWQITEARILSVTSLLSSWHYLLCKTLWVQDSYFYNIFTNSVESINSLLLLLIHLLNYIYILTVKEMVMVMTWLYIYVDWRLKDCMKSWELSLDIQYSTNNNLLETPSKYHQLLST